MSFVVIPVGIDYSDLNAVYQADRVHPNFAVVEAIIFPFDDRTVEYPDRVTKSDPVPTGIRKIFARVPRKSHA